LGMATDVLHVSQKPNQMNLLQSSCLFMDLLFTFQLRTMPPGTSSTSPACLRASASVNVTDAGCHQHMHHFWTICQLRRVRVFVRKCALEIPLSAWWKPVNFAALYYGRTHWDGSILWIPIWPFRCRLVVKIMIPVTFFDATFVSSFLTG